jgi:delta14-sterol reductase
MTPSCCQHSAVPPTLPVTAGTLFWAALMLGVFVVFLFVASLLVPGDEREGVQTPLGKQRYRLNGLRLLALTVAVVGLGWSADLFSPAVIQAYFWPIFVAANLFAFAISTILLRQGRRAAAASGKPLPDDLFSTLKAYWYGSEVNPTWAGVDLKMFSYRPSLIGFALLNSSFGFLQYQLHGLVTPQMWLFQVFTFAYVVNYFQFEYGMLYTWDIIAEKFGWMLVWGDYVFLPFFYSLPGWYLVNDLSPIATWKAVALTALYLLGFWIFRGANEQKHGFKEAQLKGETCTIWGQPAQALGNGRILISGFWGIGRKLNYTGELCMYYAWTLTTGTQSIVPYLVPIWLTLFFPHRAWRDEKKCREKYGEVWDDYCRQARFRMFPYLY